MVNTVSHPAPRQDTSTHTIYRAGASPARFHRRLGTMERGPRRLGSRPGMRKRERIGQNVWGGSMSGELISGSPAVRADPVRSGCRGSRPGSPGARPRLRRAGPRGYMGHRRLFRGRPLFYRHHRQGRADSREDVSGVDTAADKKGRGLVEPEDLFCLR